MGPELYFRYCLPMGALESIVLGFTILFDEINKPHIIINSMKTKKI